MSDAATAAATVVVHRDVVCPFCALGCDDLEVEVLGTALAVVGAVPGRCAAAFAAPLGDATSSVDGQPATLEHAIGRAAEILRSARLPLVHGLGCDTDGVRAALRLAEATGGVVDHANAGPLLANVRTMQTVGWVTVTLAEIRARADLLVLFGTDAVGLMPRFFERVAFPSSRPAGPRVVLVGEGLDAAAARSPEGREAELVVCPMGCLAEAAAVLRALAEGRRVPASDAGLPLESLRALAEALRAARYGILVWATGALPAGDAELTVSTLAELLKHLNATTRTLGLPLAGPGNVVGANQVAGWSWGVPLRAAVASGAPEYDAEAFAADRLLASGTADAQLWVSAFAATSPPSSDVPTVALVRGGTAFERPPEVVIPVGTPGLDHAGSVFRTDTVVALPLRRLRDTGLPTVAGVLEAIRGRLGDVGSAARC